MAQSFARFGSQVFHFEQSDHILPREDADAAAIVQTQMKEDGVAFLFNSRVTEIRQEGNAKRIRYSTNGETQEVVVDQILVGVGRAMVGFDTLIPGVGAWLAVALGAAQRWQALAPEDAPAAIDGADAIDSGDVAPDSVSPSGSAMPCWRK